MHWRKEESRFSLSCSFRGPKPEIGSTLSATSSSKRNSYTEMCLKMKYFFNIRSLKLTNELFFQLFFGARVFLPPENSKFDFFIMWLLLFYPSPFLLYKKNPHTLFFSTLTWMREFLNAALRFWVFFLKSGMLLS